jgi:hypothetical protein
MQMQRWQQKQEEVQQQSQDEQQDQQQQAPAGPASKQQLVATIVLESAEQEPVAMALLAAMYKGAKAVGSQGLTDAQELQVVLLADMLGMQHLAFEAVHNLGMATSSGISAEMQDEMLRLQPWPACLWPLFPMLTAFNKLSMPNLARAWMAVGCLQPDSTFNDVGRAKFVSHMLKALLHNFNELQSVWRSARLRTQLLDLPLPAMQLLLMDLQYPEVSGCGADTLVWV